MDSGTTSPAPGAKNILCTKSRREKNLISDGLPHLVEIHKSSCIIPQYLSAGARTNHSMAWPDLTNEWCPGPLSRLVSEVSWSLAVTHFKSNQYSEAAGDLHMELLNITKTKTSIKNLFYNLN